MLFSLPIDFRDRQASTELSEILASSQQLLSLEGISITHPYKLPYDVQLLQLILLKHCQQYRILRDPSSCIPFYIKYVQYKDR